MLVPHGFLCLLPQIIECSFVILLRLLCFPPTRPVPRPLLETLCRLLGTFSDPGCWTEARHLVVDLYRVGTLSDRLLLTHAFPGLLRAFTAEVARCGRATSPTKLLRDMTNVLTQAFGRALQTVSERQGLPVEPSLVEVGVSLAFESLPSLAELSVKTGAAEALVSLTESQLYGQAIMLCAAIAESLPPDGPMIRQLLDQNVPSIVLQIYEDRQGSWGRNMERALLLRYITRVVRPGNPVLKFVNMRPLGKVTHSARGRRAEYDYEENEVSFGAGLCIGKERLMLDLFQALDADSPECRLARLGLEEIEREAPSVVKEKKCSDAPKESKCCVCETEGAALKRCSLCREVAYCTVACQRKHWPEHKLVCKRKGKKNR